MYRQCLDCIHENTDHTWGALLQLRQGGGSKKTFHHLESQLNKHGLYNLMLDVTVVKEGLDIYFKTRAQADKVENLVCLSILSLVVLRWIGIGFRAICTADKVDQVQEARLSRSIIQYCSI